jgi:large subunit ribosomal protein L25
VVYGPELKENLNIKVATNELEKLFHEAGESSIISLTVEGTKEPMDTIIKEIDRDPITLRISHIDFYKVKAGEKIDATVKLVFVGESDAVKNFGGTLVTTFDEIRIKCLPRDLMHEINVDLAALKTFDDTIYIKDLNIPAGVEVLENADDAVASVSAPVVEEVKPVEEAKMPEVIGKKKEDEEAAAPEKK